MTQEFEERLRRTIDTDEVEIPADTEQAIAAGRRIVRGRRIGWWLAACALVAAAVIIVPGVLPRSIPALPAGSPNPTSAAQPATPLAGSGWSVVKLGGTTTVPGSSLALNFLDAAVTGFDGCADFGYTTTGGKVEAGWYRQDGDRLAIGEVVVSAVGCTDQAITTQAAKFLTALAAARTFTLEGDTLTFLGADGSVLVQFERAKAALAWTGWRITSLLGNPVVDGVRPPNLVFLPETLYGYDGCNEHNGTYRQDGATVSIELRGQTLQLCAADPIKRQVDDFAAALARTAEARAVGGGLTLLDSSGAVLLQASPDLTPLLVADSATWQLDNKDGSWGVEESGITLRVNDDKLFGRTGCGDYDAPYTHDGAAWTVTDVQRKNVLPCPNTTSANSERFIGLLQEVTKIEATEHQLILFTDQEALSFSRQ